MEKEIIIISLIFLAVLTIIFGFKYQKTKIENENLSEDLQKAKEEISFQVNSYRDTNCLKSLGDRTKCDKVFLGIPQ
jgi:hypothetical protein